MGQSVTAGVIVERVGDDLMIIIPGNSDVVSLSGRPAEVLLDVKTGRKVDPADPALRDLVDLGIVSAPRLSRRGLIKAGAIGAGAGVAVLAMPGVAAAASSSALTGFGFYGASFLSSTTSTYFEVRGFDFPDNFLANGEAGATAPSVLTLLGVGVAEAQYWETAGVAGLEQNSYYGGDYVTWRIPNTNPVHPDTLTEQPYVGTFTWGGVSYTAEFTRE